MRTWPQQQLVRRYLLDEVTGPFVRETFLPSPRQVWNESTPETCSWHLKVCSPRGWALNVHFSYSEDKHTKVNTSAKTNRAGQSLQNKHSSLPERIMCPEFTGSAERGCSQVVVRVSSLPHTQREEKNTCYATGKETPADRANSRRTGRDDATKRSLSHSLDEEDSAVPADAVRPVFR